MSTANTISAAADFVLALDQGTTSSRAILFDRAGKPCGIAQQEFAQHYPKPGWVEHDPEEIWQTQLAVARAVLKDNGVAASRIAAVGITNQRETTVLWDRATSEPVAPAIVWQDRRTASLCEALTAAGHAPLFAERTGLLLDPYFSGTKLRWLLDNVAGVRERAERGRRRVGDSHLVCIGAWRNPVRTCGGRVAHAGDRNTG